MKWDGERKSKVRSKVFRCDHRCGTVIDLPGEDCASLWNRKGTGMLDLGLIDSDTKVIVIDRDAKAMRKIKPQVKRRFHDVVFHEGNFETLDVPCEVDFVNLDTMSSPTPMSFDWIDSLPIGDNGVVACWFTSYRANKSTEASLSQTFFKYNMRMLFEIMRYAPDVPWDHLDITSKVTLYGLMLSLGRYDFNVDMVESYRDHVNRMCVYRFDGLRRRRSRRWPSLSEILVEVEADHNGRNGKRASFLNADMTIPDMCIAVVENGWDSAISYVTLRMRTHLENRMSQGATEKMIKAGWKSMISKKADGIIARHAQNLVDRVTIHNKRTV